MNLHVGNGRRGHKTAAVSSKPLQDPMCAPYNPTVPFFLGSLTRPMQARASWMWETSSLPDLTRRFACQSLPVLLSSRYPPSFSPSVILRTHTNNSGSGSCGRFSDPIHERRPTPTTAYRRPHYNFPPSNRSRHFSRQDSAQEPVHASLHICRNRARPVKTQLRSSWAAESTFLPCYTRGTSLTSRVYPDGCLGSWLRD